MTDRRSTLMAYPRPMTPPILGRALLHELNTKFHWSTKYGR